MIELIRLGWPVVLSYLGIMLMGIVDLVFVGRVSPVALGGVGIGTSVFSWFMVLGLGLQAGLDSIVPYSFGSGDRPRAYRALVQSIWISLGVSVLLCAGMEWVSWHLDWVGINPLIQQQTGPYLRIVIPSLPLVLVFSCIRQYLQAVNFSKPALYVLILANALNIVLNALWVPSSMGGVAHGTVGSAYATLASRMLMLTCAFLALLYHERIHRFCGDQLVWFDRVLTLELLRLGLPAMLQLSFEMGVFALATVLAGRLLPVELAAHQVVLNIASLTFMVPLGIGAATAILVGQSLGRQDSVEAKRWGWRGLKLSLSFMALTCCLFLSFPHFFLRIYTDNIEVLNVGSHILLIAALFQLSDGAQAVMTGALRGAGDTRTSAFANLFGHWMVGLPVGLWLCFGRGYRLPGLWVGLSLGLTLVAGVLVLRWKNMLIAPVRGLE